MNFHIQTANMMVHGLDCLHEIEIVLQQGIEGIHKNEYKLTLDTKSDALSSKRYCFSSRSTHLVDSCTNGTVGEAYIH